jgi:CHRD domain-containing protein
MGGIMHAMRVFFAAVLVLGLALVGHATIYNFTISLDGAQETPPNGSTSSGMGAFTLDDATGIATYNFTHNCCASGEIGAHVHGPAGPGVPAGIIYGLPGGTTVMNNSPVLTPAQQADMLSNLHYANIHSTAFPGGEIRGQILLVGTTSTTTTTASTSTTTTTLASGVQLKPSKILLVKNPPAGAFKRKIVWKVKENASSNTVTGDPVTNGATLRVTLTPGGDQCFPLPAQNWSAISSIGFKYKDADLSEGPVKVASIKKTPAGVFLVKAVISGKGPSTINVLPGNPTSSYATNLSIGGGDAYCSGTGTVTPGPNDDKTFKVVNDTTPGSCTVSACSP